MNKKDIIQTILGSKYRKPPVYSTASAFAPTNIALCKYWGKRDAELNLPVTSSLSIALQHKGTTTEIKTLQTKQHVIEVNGEPCKNDSPFGKKLLHFVSLFLEKEPIYFDFNIKTNIPIAAGLASSASGFASLVLALNQLFHWNLSFTELSILARLGSGSACRSLWQGFVEWQVGHSTDGMDSFGSPLQQKWPELCVGLLHLSHAEKKISSREGMERSVQTSPFYAAWPSLIQHNLIQIKQAIGSQDIHLLGQIAESNALAMHALVQTSWPPFTYSLPETLQSMQKIWSLRQQGLEVYFTQDAGPNLKLIFLKQSLGQLLLEFPTLELICPFEVY